jgi:drug/metabolite transporter (DMT)-like permease
MLGAIVAFTCMAVAGRAASLEHDTFEIMLFRSLAGIVIVVVLAAAFGRLGEITTRKMHLQLGRNVFHFTGQNLWFYGLTVIPLAQLFALEFTSPLWVMVLAALLLGERLTWIKGLAAAVAFSGVLLVVRPGTGEMNAGHLAAALAAICFASTAIFTKKLTVTESIICILFWLTVVQAGLGLVAVFWDGQVTWPSVTTLPWLLLIAVAGLVAHYCLTTALSLAPASVVMPMDFARLPVIVVVGALLYAEALEPIVLLGAALILLGNWINIRAAVRR